MRALSTQTGSLDQPMRWQTPSRLFFFPGNLRDYRIAHIGGRNKRTVLLPSCFHWAKAKPKKQKCRSEPHVSKQTIQFWFICLIQSGSSLWNSDGRSGSGWRSGRMAAVFQQHDENVLRKIISSVPFSLYQTGLYMILAYESNVYVSEITKCKEIQGVQMPNWGYLHLTL